MINIQKINGKRIVNMLCSYRYGGLNSFELIETMIGFE